MKKQNRKTAGSGAREPDWVLLNEKAVTIEFDYGRIIDNDTMRFNSEGLSRGKLLDKYSSSISEAVVSALQKLWPSGEVKRNMLVGTHDVKNIASVEAVTVFIIFDYAEPEKPTLKVKVLAEGEDQSIVAGKIRKIKESYEK